MIPLPTTMTSRFVYTLKQTITISVIVGTSLVSRLDQVMLISATWTAKFIIQQLNSGQETDQIICAESAVLRLVLINGTPRGTWQLRLLAQTAVSVSWRGDKNTAIELCVNLVHTPVLCVDNDGD